jgi:hypothetical protein
MLFEEQEEEVDVEAEEGETPVEERFLEGFE